MSFDAPVGSGLDFPMDVLTVMKLTPPVLVFDAPVGSGMYSGLHMLKFFLFLTAYCPAVVFPLLYRPIPATIALI